MKTQYNKTLYNETQHNYTQKIWASLRYSAQRLSSNPRPYDDEVSALPLRKCFCGLYYKDITIVNDNYRVVDKWRSKLWRHVYNHNRWHLLRLGHIYSTITSYDNVQLSYDDFNTFLVQATWQLYLLWHVYGSRCCIFSCVWPFYERAVSNLDRSMHRSLWV